MASSGAHRPDLLPGTLNLIVLRTLTTVGPQHAYGIAARIEQVANQGLAPESRHALSCSRSTGAKGVESRARGRPRKTTVKAKYYAVTRSGTRALADQAAWWQRSADLVNRLLTSEGE